MKKKIILLAGFVIALTASAAVYAQSVDPAVKILPAAEQGTLKVVYARQAAQTVTVKFIDENGLLKTDRIKPGSFNQGFLKKYDVSRIKSGKFWIEVSADDLIVRYRLVQDQNGRYVPYLEQTIYNHPLVATIN
ncbi:MAG: hypothetical protein JNN04_16075 [Cyclobacteriaceae bacterium]|nr:hypothetical protein [Cyclobacteriaceae bacterium]